MWQRRVISEARRFNVVCVGRRAGKTVLGLNRIATPQTLARPVGWFSPTYKMLLEVWREAVRVLAPITVRRNAQERRIEFLTGGLLEFWSLDNADVARGRKYGRVIVDEAAMVPNLLDIWQYALRPTLADYRGDAWFLSTPKGRNGFWTMWQWGQDEGQAEWASWQMPSTVGRIAPGEIEEMRRTLPERVFAQEILAQFLEGGGGTFRRVTDAVTAMDSGPVDGHEYVFGVDLARSNDWTVVTVYDVTTNSIVELDRYNQIDYMHQVSRIVGLCGRYRPHAVVVETNNAGQAVIEQLNRYDVPVVPFTTTNATKQSLIDGLVVAFEQGLISIPDDPVLIAELQAFEGERLPSGLMRYGAPAGMHDDTVMSLALARHGATESNGLLLWGG